MANVMERTTTPQDRHSYQLPIELTRIIADLVRDEPANLLRLAPVSHTFYFAVIPHIYTHISLAHAARRPKPKWVKTVALWSRTINSNKSLATLVETLNLHLPECDLPALYRQTLSALQSCVGLKELEIWHSSHTTPVSWLFPERPRFALRKLVSYVPASAWMARVLESQPSIRVLDLLTYNMRLPLARGSLPNLSCYTGYSWLIIQARVQGAIWENLVHAELHDAYRPMNGILDPMPRLRSLDIIVAAWNNYSLQEIALKCPELESLTLRDGNGLFHSWHDGRLIRFATAPSFIVGLSHLTHLSSLCIRAPYPLHCGQTTAAFTEKTQLTAWRASCPTLQRFGSPTGLEWVFVPQHQSSSSDAGSSEMLVENDSLGQWMVVLDRSAAFFNRTNAFATDPGTFGMRRVGSARERRQVGDVDELVAIIERLNREHISNR